MSEGAVGGCQAKTPFPVISRRDWRICGEPAVYRHVYRCCNPAHQREGLTCEQHRPVPGEVGCALCFEAGHECAVTATAEVPL